MSKWNGCYANTYLNSLRRSDAIWRERSGPTLAHVMICCLAAPSLLGAVSIRKTVLLGMVIPMLKIRRPTGRLIFNMGIPIPGKTVFYIETGPSALAMESPQSWTELSKFSAISANWVFKNNANDWIPIQSFEHAEGLLSWQTHGNHTWRNQEYCAVTVMWLYVT